MGKTPKPLHIAVLSPLFDWEEIQHLVEQGHIVTEIEPTSERVYDLILGPTCWLMDEQHRKYLDLAIAAARAKRYPKEAKHE